MTLFHITSEKNKVPVPFFCFFFPDKEMHIFMIVSPCHS